MTEVTSTRRQRRNYRPRRTHFAALAGSAGAQLDATPAGVEAVYLTGPRPAAGWLTWALSGLGGGWRPTDPYLDPSFPILRYERPEGPHGPGQRVELHRAEQWFGEAVTPDDAAAAWAILGRVLRQVFRTDTDPMLATPATTGRVLFLRTIGRDAVYPVLDADTQELIRATSAQGRNETLPRVCEWCDSIADASGHGEHKHETHYLDALYEYDATLAYAALLWQVPIGQPTHDAGDEYCGFAPARYRVRVTVPRDWPERFGLFGVRTTDGSGLWRYPNTPGETFTTWIDGAELHVAQAHAPRWLDDLRILERLVWTATAHVSPLRRWGEKLVKARALCEQISRANAARYAYRDPNPADRAGRAVRALLLHGIGAFQGRPQMRTRFVAEEYADRIPADAQAIRLEGDWLIYETPAPDHEPNQWRAALAHPEWCASIWGKARARLLAAPDATGALYRSAGEVVAFRTDAIYFTARQEWPESDQVGRYRLKNVWAGPLKWPNNATDLLAIRNLGG